MGTPRGLSQVHYLIMYEKFDPSGAHLPKNPYEVPGTFLAFSTTTTYIDNNIKTNLPFRKLAKETSVFCRSVFWHRLTTTNLSTVAT